MNRINEVNETDSKGPSTEVKGISTAAKVIAGVAAAAVVAFVSIFTIRSNTSRNMVTESSAPVTSVTAGIAETTAAEPETTEELPALKATSRVINTYRPGINYERNDEQQTEEQKTASVSKPVQQTAPSQEAEPSQPAPTEQNIQETQPETAAETESERKWIQLYINDHWETIYINE